MPSEEAIIRVALSELNEFYSVPLGAGTARGILQDVIRRARGDSRVHVPHFSGEKERKK